MTGKLQLLCDGSASWRNRFAAQQLFGVEKRRNSAALQTVAELPRSVVRLRFGVRRCSCAFFLLHRSLPSELGGLADCWNFSSDFTKFPGNGRTRSKIRAARGLAVV